MIYEALQLILVVTGDWDAQKGQMFRFEREALDQPFQSHGQAIPIVVGQNGLAWGLGLHPLPKDNRSDPIKQEGDKRAPAGIFRLGPIFIDKRFPIACPFQIPVLIVDEHWEAIDDPTSGYYNQLVDASTIKTKDWTSSELMQREDELYHLGLVIHHNADSAIPGCGSCIFMHSWRGNENGTFGCTALSGSDLKEVLSWLNAEKYPLLIQLPEEEYQRQNETWGLPSLEKF